MFCVVRPRLRRKPLLPIFTKPNTPPFAANAQKTRGEQTRRRYSKWTMETTILYFGTRTAFLLITDRTVMVMVMVSMKRSNSSWENNGSGRYTWESKVREHHPSRQSPRNPRGRHGQQMHFLTIQMDRNLPLQRHPELLVRAYLTRCLHRLQL